MDNTQSEQSTRLSKPTAVIISDVHYSLSTLPLADTAFRAAIDKAALLGVPVIDAGDVTNDKAIIRAEVANALIQTLEYARKKHVGIYFLVGNHSMINEKGKDHALEFLRPYATIIDTPQQYVEAGVVLIPYQNDSDKLLEIIKSIHPGPILIMHQGFMGAAMGDYVVDKTSIPPDAVKDFTVFSGHYHRHQTIGTVTYIGSPYTMSFGEANDGPKGFLILNSDGTYQREILHLRKHVKVERDIAHAFIPEPGVNKDDLLWLKITGPASHLYALNKELLGRAHIGHSNFKLDLIPDSAGPSEVLTPTTKMTDLQVLEKLINSHSETDERRQYLKELAHALLDG